MDDQDSQAEGNPPSGTAPSSLSSRRKIGRRLAQGLYYIMIGAIGVAVVVQVSRQVFFAATPPEPARFASCDEGLRELVVAIERGRHVAEWSTADGGDTDEEVALSRYRTVVETAWRHRDAVAAMCTGERRAALDAVERLRYSEEHGVRSQAGELTALRARVRKLVGQSSDEP
ncbi:MAG: hypothetical protein DRI90_26865 [Deltaproteobacteria bacterium]|nr:MAG: hypothetical protein DRI90_26865 [Deltaproteobacteria bacterium]